MQMPQRGLRVRHPRARRRPEGCFDGPRRAQRPALATSAALAAAEERDIMRQTRNKSVAVARRYIRDGSLFRSNAAAVVGL
jgi:hypothetical protein